MEDQELTARLVADFAYTPEQARELAGDLLRCAPPIQSAFRQWWTTGQLPELEVAGYTLRRLIDDYRLKPPAAFTTLDWLLSDPSTARRVLQKGFDRIR